MVKQILLPGDPEFDLTLGLNLPPDWKEFACQNNGSFGFVARAGSGILEPIAYDDLPEYIEGGEYEERLNEIGDEDILDEFYGVD